MQTDLSKLTDAELQAELEKRRPALKHVHDMTDAEYQAARRDVKMGRVRRP